MMNTKEIKRLVILNIPYVILGLLATNLGEAWRLAAGTDISEKILALFGTIPGKRSLHCSEQFRRHSGIPYRVCIRQTCAWDLYAEPYCVLRSISAVRMQKSTGTMWSTVLRGGVHNFKCKGTIHGRTGGYAHD